MRPPITSEYSHAYSHALVSSLGCFNSRCTNFLLRIFFFCSSTSYLKKKNMRVKAAGRRTLDVLEQSFERRHRGKIHKVGRLFRCNPFCRLIVTDLWRTKNTRGSLVFKFSHLHCIRVKGFLSPRSPHFHKRAQTAGTPPSRCRNSHPWSSCAEQRKD